MKKPHICQRQRFQQNAVGSEHSVSLEQATEDYFRVSITIPLLDDVLVNMRTRFDNGQDTVAKGTMLIPAYLLKEPTWKTLVQPFVSFYVDDLPSKHTVDAEFEMWNQKWNQCWDERLKTLKEQHLQAT